MIAKASSFVRDLDHAIPSALVAVAVLFNLVVLRPELRGVLAANDLEQHLIMVRWARDRIAAGHNPLDGWYPYLGLGSPHFHHYQSLPHIFVGAIATLVGAVPAYFWSLYLLVALWPVCVYISGRLFGASRWICGAAALMSLLVASVPENSIGFEYAAYLRGGFGVWAQLWGMWLLPLALALTWRAVHRDGSYLWPAIALALLLASHFLTAYLAVIVIGAWIFVRRRGIGRRIMRTAAVGGGALLVGAWAIVPPILDSPWASRLESLVGSVYSDSYGPATVVRWLVAGRIFDAGRPPVITLFVFVGIAVCIVHRRDDRARALLAMFCVSLALYMGRSVVGPVLNRLPIGEEILLHRYIMGVHLAGIFLAAVGAVWLGNLTVSESIRRLPKIHRWLAAKPPRRPFVPSRQSAIVVAVLLGFLLLLPAYRERFAFESRAARAIDDQAAAGRTTGRDVRALVEIAKRRGDGRITGGMFGALGDTYKIGSVPVYLALARYEADAVGYKERTLSLMSNVEHLFNDFSRAQFDLFNVKYVLRPAGFSLTGAEKLAERGSSVLWRVRTSGYLGVIDTRGTIEADRTDLGLKMTPLMASPTLDPTVLPTVAFGGRSAARPTLDGKVPRSKPGRVLDQRARPADGRFSGRIVARRRAVVLLKSSFDPRWRIVVDGKRAEPQMIAPAFVGAVVQPGVHDVTFEYQPLPYYVLLFLASLVGLAALSLGPRLAARRGSAVGSEAATN
jgi:hypothetical protein